MFWFPLTLTTLRAHAIFPFNSCLISYVNEPYGEKVISRIIGWDVDKFRNATFLAFNDVNAFSHVYKWFSTTGLNYQTMEKAITNI